MSLFERLNNKRYDLQEIKKKTSSSASSGNNNSDQNISTSRRRIKKQIEVVKSTQPKIETGRTTYSKNQNPSTRPSDNKPKRGSTTIKTSSQLNLFTKKPEPPKEVPVKTTYKPRVKKKVVSSDPTIPGIDDESISSKTTATKTKPVKQSEVSQKAKDFTKEINKKNKNRTFFDPEKAKEARKNLIAKRKEYGIDRKGNISDAGVKRYAQKTKQLSSGRNVPAKITQADMDSAKKRMIDKYGRRLGRVRNKNMPSLDQVKKDIELRPLKQKLKKKYNINREQQRTIQKKLRIDKAIARSGESGIKFRDAARSVASKIPGLSREVTLPAIGNQPGKKVKALKPIVKKVIQGVQKAGPGGAVVAGAGLALLNPSIRKTAKRVAKVALGAAGVKAFTSKPKLASRPPTSIGINLSSGKAKSKPSDFALKRQELLKKDPNKVANKNLA